MAIKSFGAPNPYISNGATNEQDLIDNLTIESIGFNGVQVVYIPRTIVSLDSIFGEDRLSQFKRGETIEMYLKDASSFSGQGGFISKFGLVLDQSATFVVSRTRWAEVVANSGSTTLPTRPAEGDLIWFPLSDGLFEIKNVDYQNPFYALNNLYVYSLNVQLFSYGSEHIQTGIADIDGFETLKSMDTTVNPTASGSEYLNADNKNIDQQAAIEVFNPSNPFNTP